MTPSPDKLFRDGLEDYRKQAPSAAWDKIASGLHRKRRKNVWMRIAASITILLAVSVLFFQKEQHIEIAASKDPKVIDAPPAIRPESTSEQNTIDQFHSIKNIDAQKDLSIATKQRSTNKDEQIKFVENEKVETKSEVHPEKIIATSTETIADLINEAIEVAANTVIQKEPVESHMHIVYTSQDVKTKFRKKVLPVEATPEQKNTSGLQKVIDIAVEIKNDDSMYGDLRQKKNEILSFSFLENNRGPNR